VLLAGVGVLVPAACTSAFGTDRVAGLDAMAILGSIWLAAAVAGAVAIAVARVFAARLGRRWSPETLFVASLVLPAVGAALVLPLTLHMLVALVFAAPPPSFNMWVELSLYITGFTHIVFAISCALRAHSLAAGRPAASAGKIYTWTVLTSCVPFGLLVLPPVLVAITALPFIPMLRAMERVIDRERAEIAALPRALPRATAVALPRGA
jgi:hypothetical protein